jgi:hypothetical protein
MFGITLEVSNQNVSLINEAMVSLFAIYTMMIAEILLEQVFED